MDQYNFKEGDVVIEEHSEDIYRIARISDNKILAPSRYVKGILLYDGVDHMVVNKKCFCNRSLIKSSISLLTFQYIENEIKNLNILNDCLLKIGQDIIDCNKESKQKIEKGNVLIGLSSRFIYQVVDVTENKSLNDIKVNVLYDFLEKSRKSFRHVSSRVCNKATLSCVDEHIKKNNEKINFLLSIMDDVINQEFEDAK